MVRPPQRVIWRYGRIDSCVTGTTAMATTIAPIQWQTWEPLQLPVQAALRDVDAACARQVFDVLMTARTTRIAALCQLAAHNGCLMPPHATAAAAHELGTWLHAALPISYQRDRQTPLAAQAPELWGLGYDVTLWIGEGLCAAAPNLHWQLLATHKKSTGYQRAVLSGFSKVAARDYYVDIAHFVAGWLELVVRRRAARADFLAHIFSITARDA